MMLFLKFFLWLSFIIGIVIFIHEFGHFIAAKLLGIKVEEFAFGFGKKIISKKFGDTLYRINCIPYGGYVKLLGEEKSSDSPDSFSVKSLWIRGTVVVAGVMMNFLLAVVVFYGILTFKDFQIYFPRYADSDYNFLGSVTEVLNKPFVGEVIEGSPAAEANFPTNSMIWSINDEEITEVEDFHSFLEKNRGKEVKIELLVFGEELARIGRWEEVNVRLREDDEEGVLLGVRYDETIASYYKLDYTKIKPLAGLLHSLNFTGYNLDIFKDLITVSFREKSVKPVSENVVGVVGMANITLDLVRVGSVLDLWDLLAGVNLSLAIINVLPIPGLDGGHLLFMIIEKVRGRKLAEKYQEWAIKIGFVFFIALGILITVKDIIQFDVVPRSINWVKNLF